MFISVRLPRGPSNERANQMTARSASLVTNGRGSTSTSVVQGGACVYIEDGDTVIRPAPTLWYEFKGRSVQHITVKKEDPATRCPDGPYVDFTANFLSWVLDTLLGVY